jgi:hypothetical protein
VQVGRIRQSLVFGAKGLDLFVCGDQLLRGAASNAVFIAEAIVFPEKYAAPPPQPVQHLCSGHSMLERLDFFRRHCLGLWVCTHAGTP